MPVALPKNQLHVQGYVGEYLKMNAQVLMRVFHTSVSAETVMLTRSEVRMGTLNGASANQQVSELQDA